MKTVQYYLKNTERKKLLGALSYDLIQDTLALLEMKDHTIAEIEEAYENRMSELIDHLISLKVQPSENMVLYLSNAKDYDGSVNKTLDLIDLDDIRKDIYATGYGFEFTKYDEALGYLVADNKLTQDYLTDLLTQFIRELTFFGIDPKGRQEKVDEVISELDRSMAEDKAKSVGGILEEIEREWGLPVDEKDEVQDALKSEITKAEIEYNRYCHFQERKRILESLGETTDFSFAASKNADDLTKENCDHES